MAEQITYTGNAGLGTGSNPGIAAPGGDVSLNAINDTLRTLMLQNNDWNVRKYQQKVADRDKLNQLIVEGQVAIGDIDKEYQPIYDEARRRSEKEYQKWGGNLNDTEGYRRWQASIQDLKDIAAHAQIRTKDMRALEKQRSGIVSPTKQKEFDAFYEKEKAKPFWEQVGIYQPMYDWQGDKISGLATALSRTEPLGKDGIEKRKTDYYTFDQALKNSQFQWLNDIDTRDAIDGITSELMKLAPDQRASTFSHINNRLKQYNNEVGQLLYGRALQEGDKEFAADIQAYVDPASGEIVIKEPLQSFAAKWSLAEKPQFVTSSSEFDKERADYSIKKGDLAVKQMNAATNARKTNAYIAKVGAEINKLKTDQEKDQFISSVYTDTITNQPLTVTSNDGTVRQTQIQAQNVAPIFTFDKGKPVQLKPIGSTDITDNAGKVIGYEGGHYNQRYSKNGRSVDLPVLVSELNDMRKKATDAGFSRDQWKSLGIETVEDYIKKSFENGLLEVNLQGANGTTTRDLNKGALLGISNTLSKKGQQQPFMEEPPATE